jgi:hypothetical protein
VGPGKDCCALEARHGAKRSTLKVKVKVQAPPEMGLEEVERAGTPVVTRDQIRQVGRSAGRQVGRSAGRQVGRSAGRQVAKSPSRQVAKSPSRHHPSCEKSGAMIGLGLPERQRPPQAASDHQDTPWADYRNFGVASVEVGD